MNHRHRKVLQALFAHPLNANIRFRDAEKVFEELGAEVSNAQTGRLHVSLKGHSANFPIVRQAIPKEEVMRIRKFLQDCGVDPVDYPV